MLNLFTVLLVAISLSMDTFSLSIVCGALGIDRKKILTLSLIVGIFHFFMPILGNIIGNYILRTIVISSDLFVGIIFIVLSIQMLFQKEDTIVFSGIVSFLLFAFTVSIDSFSVGIGLSSITTNYFLSYCTFSLVSFSFTYVGLRFGNLINKKVGTLANYVGVLILFLLGVFYVF